MATLIRVLLGIAKLLAAEAIAMANIVYAGLNGNPAYPNPPVPMDVFRAAIDKGQAALLAALDGGTKAIQEKEAALDVLKAMLHKLARYVEIQCDGNLQTLLSSGFQ